MKEFVLSTLSSSRPCNYLSFSCASARHTHSDSIQTAIRIPDASLSGACSVYKDLFISIQNARSGEVEPAPYLMEREILKVTTLLVSLRCGSW